ncbi:OmpA family protein [uncultured Muribaculum sp.]|uniref:OmpA/MotB family protein n=1 Tax=uncultured Muribaculum sp. TaxID=1918613 RepID=UPI00267453CA|nr:OmpA family protein [uncultured Muribaculum sp.]
MAKRKKILLFAWLFAIFSCLYGQTDCYAQNFWERLTGSNKPKTENIKSNDNQKSNKKKQNIPETDPHDYSLDENLLVPAVPQKLHDAVTRHMNSTAKKLAQRKLEKIETLRNGEVIVATIGTDGLFAPNDTIPRKEADELLRPYYNLLNLPGYYKIVMALHTDNTGSEQYTDYLSEARINEIYNLMASHTDNEGQLIPYALGASDPLLPNDSQNNRATNRRLEIFIVPDKLLIEMARTHKLQ